MNESPENRKRIWIVLPALGKDGQLGGAERVAVQLVNHLQRNGPWDIHLCVIGAHDPFYASYGLAQEPLFLEQPDFHVSLRRWVHAVARLRHVLREERPSIVHSHLWPADLAVAAAINPGESRHLVHIHDAWVLTGSASWRRVLRRVLYRQLLKRSRARFIACAAAVKAEFVQRMHFASAHIEVIHNGLEPDWLRDPPVRPPENDRFQIGYAARLQRGKGQDVLIEAAAQVIRSRPSARILLAGDGSRREAYRQKACNLKIEDRVVFLGRVWDMRSFYDQLDVYACPSLSEGLPLSVLEAMARGLPVVASRVGGTPEIIRHGVDGLLVPPRAPNELAQALIALAQDAELRGRLGCAARKRVEEHFPLSRTVEAVANRYHTLLGSA